MKFPARALLTLTLLLIMLVSVRSQTMLLWDDQSAIFTNKGSQLLESKLLENDIAIMMTMDFSKRCDYLYGEFNKTMNQAVLSIFDCNRKMLGTQTWMSKFFTLPEDERVALIAFAVVEIIEKNMSTLPDHSSGADQGFQRAYSIPFNHHLTRYFFTPSSFNLSKGELYYSTLFFASHDLQYGITDNFSIGMGTTLILNPFYVTPKYSFRANEKNSFSVGTMLMIGTWTNDLLGNLGYLTYTRGDQFNNITLGIGHLYMEDDSDVIANRVIGNISAMARVSDHLYFVTENYTLSLRSNYTARKYDPINWETIYSEKFSLNTTYLAGMAGFRFVNKTLNVSAFQFGLGYIIRFRQPLPEKFTAPDIMIDGNTKTWKRFILPTIGFVHKLGKRV